MSQRGIDPQKEGARRRKTAVTLRKSKQQGVLQSLREVPETEEQAYERLCEYAGQGQADPSLWGDAMVRVIRFVEADEMLKIHGVALPFCASVIASPDPPTMLRKDAVWALSNFACCAAQEGAEGGFLCDAVLTAVPPHTVVRLASSSHTPLLVRKEALYLLLNLSEYGRFDHVSALVEAGLLKELSTGLQQLDRSSVKLCLDVVYSVLWWGDSQAKEGGEANAFLPLFRECGGFDAVDRLVDHDSDEIHEAAVYLVDAINYTEEDACPMATDDPTRSPGFSF